MLNSRCVFLTICTNYFNNISDWSGNSWVLNFNQSHSGSYGVNELSGLTDTKGNRSVAISQSKVSGNWVGLRRTYCTFISNKLYLSSLHFGILSIWKYNNIRVHMAVINSSSAITNLFELESCRKIKMYFKSV